MSFKADVFDSDDMRRATVYDADERKCVDRAIRKHPLWKTIILTEMQFTTGDLRLVKVMMVRP